MILCVYIWGQMIFNVSNWCTTWRLNQITLQFHSNSADCGLDHVSLQQFSNQICEPAGASKQSSTPPQLEMIGILHCLILIEVCEGRNLAFSKSADFSYSFWKAAILAVSHFLVSCFSFAVTSSYALVFIYLFFIILQLNFS